MPDIEYLDAVNAIVAGTTKRYYVAFMNSDNPSPFVQRMRKGFQHVCVLSQHSAGVVFGFNPRMCGLEIAVEIGDVTDSARKLRREGATIIIVNVIAPDYDLSRRWLVQSCATVCAYHMGIPVRAWTPWQLYKALMARGAEVWQ